MSGGISADSVLSEMRRGCSSAPGNGHATPQGPLDVPPTHTQGHPCGQSCPAGQAEVPGVLGRHSAPGNHHLSGRDFGTERWDLTPILPAAITDPSVPTQRRPETWELSPLADGGFGAQGSPQIRLHGILVTLN